MNDLTKLTISGINKGLLGGQFSSEELTLAYLDNIKKLNSDLNAFILVDEKKAIDSARLADKRIKDGNNITKLTGVPYGIKDLFATKGMRTTACSKALENFIPNYESTVTQKLIDAGCVSLGKLNMDEFAMGSANLSGCFGKSKNPYRGKNGEDLVPGGSSGASAAAVAANLAAFTLGSDTGGSVRQPASFCGVVGIRPTYGRCSRFGMVAFCSSLDQAGPITRNVEDSAAVLEVISGHDAKDSTSSNMGQFTYKKIENILDSLRVGIPKECYIDGVDKKTTQIWEESAAKLSKLGADVVDISIPSIKHSLPVYYIICCAEASSNLARYDGIRYGPDVKEVNSIEDLYGIFRSENFGDEVQRRILIGSYVLSSGYYDEYYAKAKRVQNLISLEFQEVFKDVDIIINPTCPTAAFAVDKKLDPITMYMNDIFTVPASIARLPAISVPIGFSDCGLPLGIQITANSFQENLLFNVATNLEG